MSLAVVTQCSTCPMRGTHERRLECNIVGGPGHDEMIGLVDTVPTRCPLRAGPVIVKLKESP